MLVCDKNGVVIKGKITLMVENLSTKKKSFVLCKGILN